MPSISSIEWKKTFAERFVELGADKEFANISADNTFEAYRSEILIGEYDPVDAAEDEFDALKSSL